MVMTAIMSNSGGTGNTALTVGCPSLEHSVQIAACISGSA